MEKSSATSSSTALSSLTIFINGKKHVIRTRSVSYQTSTDEAKDQIVVENLPKTTLLQYLRLRGKGDFSGLTGTKLGCGEGFAMENKLLCLYQSIFEQGVRSVHRYAF